MYCTEINLSLFLVPYFVKPDTGGQQTDSFVRLGAVCRVQRYVSAKGFK